MLYELLTAPTVPDTVVPGTPGDHDAEYRHFSPTVAQPFPFSTRQLARLLAVRSHYAAGDYSESEHVAPAFDIDN